MVLAGIPIGIASFFLVLVCVALFFVCLELRGMHRFQRFDDAEAEVNEAERQREKKEKVEMCMQKLEKIEYSGAGDGKQSECAICLKEFEKGEQVDRIPTCKHIFHDQCVKDWFLQFLICPMCRGNILPDQS